MQKRYIAHINENNEQQTIKNHLENVAKLAEEFAHSFGADKLTYLCGLTHDIGKYSNRFQKRILEGGNKVDHSTAGAQELISKLNEIGFLLAYCVAGHHTGLPDGGSKIDPVSEGTLNSRLKKKIEPYLAYSEEIDITNHIKDILIPIHPLAKGGFSVSFFIRMLFSCLVDADYLDTENFMYSNVDRWCCDDIDSLTLKIDRYVSKFKNPTSKINIKRTEILNDCIEKSQSERGLYTLTVPTGGGKTISSLAFALNHAKKNNMQRIIYVIPYNSIIEQNAAEFKNILGEDCVLEHHSDFNYDDSNEQLKKLRLAAENWDMPVIVTTNVQFFESFFSNKTSRCRKLHNIANSVIVFDEAQMLPKEYLMPCIRVISELVYNYKSTALLCSATQPALKNLFPTELISKEICENTGELYELFRRTDIVNIGEIDNDDLANKLNAEKQVLCIVNTKKHAQTMYKLLNKEGAYHLSTSMCPEHRKQVLKQIRERLKNNQACRVVSTSLIEAGVDVDFPIVYRAEAGIDSQIQAAGRCNRENKRDISPVYIFIPPKEYRKGLPPRLRRPIEVSKLISRQFNDISSPKAISSYFSMLYKFEGDGLDKHNIVSRFEEGMRNEFSFPFASIAAEFKIIDETTYPVIVPYDDSVEAVIQRIKNGERNRQILRQIQHYTVNVYENVYESLYDSGSIEKLDEQLALLVDIKKYSKEIGLELNIESGNAFIV